MKRHSILLAVSAAFCALLSSCANMQVATDVLKMYPMTCLIRDVAVYEGQKSPANYEHLGTVAVYDQGMTKVTPYENAIDMAKRAVCEAGGNALYISRHEEPNSLVSPNHQFIGQILLDTGDKPGSNKCPAYDIEVKKELSEYAADHYRVPDGPQVINGNNLYVNFGYGRLLTSAKVDESISIDRGTLENGFTYNFGYEHIFPSGKWGLGVFSSNFTSAFDATIEMTRNVTDSVKTTTAKLKYDGKYRVNLHMVGPSASYSKTDSHLFLSARAGLGLAWQTESFAFSDLVYGAGIDAQSGVMRGSVYYGGGFQVSGEIGYRVTSLITFGATVGASGYVMVYGDQNTKSLGFSSVASICPTIRITL